ncbi:hypothetical protein C8Q74DRAFT_1301870 [Fomes fomentarius]|nr:hypothetical protein C8Q74DRAFT_1301870 [Fomes fomentarius]
MMRSPISFFLVAFLALMAGKVAALGVNITGFEPNMPMTDFLNTPDVVRTTDCASNCTLAQTAITNCNGADACLCSNETAVSIVMCEQCMFTSLIARNKKPDDGRAGQTSAIAAYLAACGSLGNDTLPDNASVRNAKNATFKLVVPDNWNGPFGQGLDIPATVVTVIAGAILGVGLITVVNTM